jgi:PAS domain S-box-containing protein
MTGAIQHIQNEEYYKLVADNINDLVALYSLEGTLEYVSPSVYKLLGYEEGTLEGANPLGIIHPEDHHLLKRTFRPYGGGASEVIVFEYRLLHKNGNWIYFETYRKPIRDDNGNLLNILAVCRDISLKKNAEQELRKSEEHYRMLADNIIDMVCLYKIDGTRLYISPSCYSLLGFTPEELTGKNITDILHPDDLEKVRRDVKHKAFKGEEKFITDLRFRNKAGQWLDCETTTKAIRNENGRVTAFVATSRDITAWKNAQVALKESEEKYRSLVESSDAMISIVDKECRFLFVNDKRADFFCATKENVIGKTIYDFYEGKNARTFNERVQHVFATKQKSVYETFLEFNNREYWLRATMHPVFDSTGGVSTVMINTIDITAIKESENALREQNEELKQIAFLQSHIVRSPLTNVQGILNLMEENPLSEEQRLYLNLMKQATNKLDTIIKEIVDRAVVVRKKTRG